MVNITEADSDGYHTNEPFQIDPEKVLPMPGKHERPTKKASLVQIESHFFSRASVLVVVLVCSDVNCAVKDPVLAHNVLQNVAGQHLGIVSGVDEGRTGGKRIIT